MLMQNRFNYSIRPPPAPAPLPRGDVNFRKNRDCSKPETEWTARDKLSDYPVQVVDRFPVPFERGVHPRVSARFGIARQYACNTAWETSSEPGCSRDWEKTSVRMASALMAGVTTSLAGARRSMAMVVVLTASLVRRFTSPAMRKSLPGRAGVVAVESRARTIGTTRPTAM